MSSDNLFSARNWDSISNMLERWDRISGKNKLSDDIFKNFTFCRTRLQTTHTSQDTIILFLHTNICPEHVSRKIVVFKNVS